MTQDIVDLIEAVKNKDYLKVIILFQKIYEGGSIIYHDCFEETLGANWPCFGACLLSHGAGAIPALSEIIKAIRAKNWSKVANLTLQAVIKALPIFASCLGSC